MVLSWPGVLIPMWKSWLETATQKRSSWSVLLNEFKVDMDVLLRDSAQEIVIYAEYVRCGIDVMSSHACSSPCGRAHSGVQTAHLLQ